MARRGEVDIATFMTGVFYEDVKKDPKLRLLLPPSATRWIVYFTRNGTLSRPGPIPG